MALELKHLRKGNISKIHTEVLEKELSKLQERKAKYEAMISDNEVMFKILEDRLANNGEDTSSWFGGGGSAGWSEDKKEYVRLKDVMRSAEHGIKTVMKKIPLIEEELTDRILTGET